MIELQNKELVFSFPEVHKKAVLRINFQRTLRIPDDEREHALPAGLGKFPMEHVDDFEQNIPESWVEHGGVMLPMYQSEAMWLNFRSQNDYPFVVKIATGKINAVTGELWKDGINRDPQDYLQIPSQPWLDGFCVKKGVIRQFVAMPLGDGYTAEEQITGKAEFGGLQISVHPIKRAVYEKFEREERAREEARRRQEEKREEKKKQQLRDLLNDSALLRKSLAEKHVELEENQRMLLDIERTMEQSLAKDDGRVNTLNEERVELLTVGRLVSETIACILNDLEKIDNAMNNLMGRYPAVCEENMVMCCCAPAPDMGFAPGGKMRQEIYEDQYKLDDWDHDVRSRCFVHLANSGSWLDITGNLPPHRPPTATDYYKADLPWFDYYDDFPAVAGADALRKLKSVKQMAMDNGEPLWVQDDSIAVEAPVEVGPKKRPSRRKVRIREC